MDALFYVFGLAICGCILLQLALWTSATVANLSHHRHQLDASRRLISQKIDAARSQKVPATDDYHWKGYREFYVASLKNETIGITSVYLKPLDHKSIPAFQAGQHLPMKFHVPGQSKPLVRCYSLSTGPRNDYYRISVKAVPAPDHQPDLPAGRVSNFINSNLMVGDIVEAKCPSGTFTLPAVGESPIVLLAAGIGITPILSMLEELVEHDSTRTVVLLYGVRCGREHAFKDRIVEIANQHRHIHVIHCYSDPVETDRQGVDYQYHGWVNIDLIKRLMPDNRCMFYLCGPPPFMQSLRSGLADWGVPENRIRYEAFGPATIRKPAAPAAGIRQGPNIEFVRTGKQVTWSSDFESILNVAEANHVVVDSGCRAGSCKTCCVSVIEGRVSYPDGMEIACEPGECLPCIAIPAGDLKLDA